MRTLLLLRHAKSSWDDPALDDFDRPLSGRGRRDAARMGEEMRARRHLPDLVLCSPAARTRATWDLLGPRLGSRAPVRYPAPVYEAAPGRLLEAIRAVPGHVRTLLLVGHNPGLASLALALAAADSAPQALARLERKFPTGALAVLVTDAPWSELRRGAARLTSMLRPKDLED